MMLGMLMDGIGITLPAGIDVDVISVEDDSRCVLPGSLFVAVTGFETDGHRYIGQAIEAGAVVVVAEHDVPGVPGVLVNPEGDNRKLLAELAARFHRRPWEDLITVGITGTNGKTSTARMLAWILESEGLPTGIMGTVGHVVGGTQVAATVTTPGSLETTKLMADMRNSGDRCCVMEVSSHALSMSRVDAVRFDAGVFTNISQDHLDHHGSMEEYLACKLRLFDLLKNDGTALLGTYGEDHPVVDGAVTFGTAEGDDYRIEDIRVSPEGTSFLLDTPSAPIRVDLGAPGRFNAYNAAGAIATASALGVDPLSAAEHLSTFPGVPGRFEVVRLGQDFLVAVDYAHTPDALERVLKQGAELKRGRLITVFGAGGDRDRSKRPLMGKIASGISDLTVVTSDNPRTEVPETIIADILSGVPEADIAENRVLVQPDRRTAIRTAVASAASGDVVVIAGKGHEDYQILGRKKIHFDDREEAASAIREVMDRAAR